MPVGARKSHGPGGVGSCELPDVVLGTTLGSSRTKLLIQSVVFFKVPSLMYKIAISLIYALRIPHKYKAFENIIDMLFWRGHYLAQGLTIQPKQGF